MLDVMLLHGRPINVKISDRSIRHDFNIMDGMVEYIVLYEGSPVTRSPAELLELKEDEYGHIVSMVVRTTIYDFEIIPDEVYTFHAYRCPRH